MKHKDEIMQDTPFIEEYMNPSRTPRTCIECGSTFQGVLARSCPECQLVVSVLFTHSLMQYERWGVVPS